MLYTRGVGGRAMVRYVASQTAFQAMQKQSLSPLDFDAKIEELDQFMHAILKKVG